MNFFIKTLGCRVNRAESREIVEKLIAAGWKQAAPPRVCILNTCSVTQKAEKETRQEARRLKREHPKSFLIVTGCAVDYWQKMGKIPNLGADLYLRNSRKIDIPHLLPEVRIDTNLGGWNNWGGRVFLKIQDGCQQFCAYCIVPFLRSRSRSVPVDEVVRKIKQLEKQGVKEIILCGINLADYQPSLTFLLKRVLKESKILRFRLGSINLEAFNDRFIALWADKRLCPHFHIPLQSASNRTLKRMGRGYTFGKFKRLTEKLRERIPSVNVTTDVLVGFPGETDGEFEESSRHLEWLKGPVSKTHVFRYSPRKGTRAAKMQNQVSEKVKTARAKRMRELSQKMSEVFTKQFVGQQLKVLFEVQKNGFWQGWSENYLRVQVKDKALRGQIKVVRIEKYKGGILDGRVTA